MTAQTSEGNNSIGPVPPFARSRLPELLLFLLALITRLVGVQSRTLWYDEAFSVLFAEKGIAAMLQGTIGPATQLATGPAADIHPLLYYVLLHVWLRIFGSTPAAVRLLSISFGIGMAALLYVLVSKLLGRRVGLLAGFLAALSPFQVHYSQEVRMYALLGLLLVGAALAFWQATTTGKMRWWLLFALLAALAQYSHNLAAVHLVALAATALFTRRKKSILGAFYAGLGALLLYLPWLMVLISQIARIRAGYWIERPGFDRLLTALLSYVTGLPLNGIVLPAGLIATGLVVALGAWQTVKAGFRSSMDAETQRGLWLAWLAFSPIILLLAISQWQPVFIERALLPSGAFFLAWLAWVLAPARMPAPVRWFAGAALLFGLGVGLASHWSYRGFPYADFPQIGRSLLSRYHAGDLILHSNKLTALPLIYYAPEMPQGYLPDPAGSGSDTLLPATQQVLGIKAEEDLESATRDSERVWFIIFTRAVEEYRQVGAAHHPHLDWLDQHFSLSQTETFEDLQLFLYER